MTIINSSSRASMTTIIRATRFGRKRDPRVALRLVAGGSVPLYLNGEMNGRRDRVGCNWLRDRSYQRSQLARADRCANAGPAIRASAGDRRERAKARGVKMGRCRKLADYARHEAIELRNGCEPMHEIGLACNVSHGIVSKFVAGPLHSFGAKV